MINPSMLPTSTFSPPGPRPAHASEPAPHGVLLLEVAWEVANQLGGIYQVLRSKAPFMVDRWGESYFMIGPYVRERAAVEVEPLEPAPWIARALDALAAEGLRVHHGKWLVAGHPQVLLIEHELPVGELNALKHRTWEDHGIEFPSADPIIDPVLSFAAATRRLVNALQRAWAAEAHNGAGPRRVLAQLHEWMGGLAIPMLRRDEPEADRAGLPPLAVTFTTHATQLGRAIAYNNDRMYDEMASFDHDAEATRYHLRTQHAIERACAAGAHCFTTVSPITGEECAHLLGRSPDVITPNGLNISQYNVGHDFQTFHARFKERIHRFVMGHFFPSYAFDLDRTLYAFTSGRFEARNKGFDLAIDAMAHLNRRLKAEDLGVTVVFFIVTQRPTRSLDPLVLRARGVLHELESQCRRITEEVGDGLFRRSAAGDKPHLDDLLDDQWHLRVRRIQAAFRTTRTPPVITHVIDDEAGDPELQHIHRAGLHNAPDDPVKIVYHPEFINPTNPLWGLEYEQFVRGCHIGLFPSSYEPWGYTPLECVAMGVPAVTSDLAGFGRYVGEETQTAPGSGLLVLARRGRTFDESAAALASHVLTFCRLDRRGRIALRNDVERRSWDFDWSHFGRAYDAAHEVALYRATRTASLRPAATPAPAPAPEELDSAARV